MTSVGWGQSIIRLGAPPCCVWCGGGASLMPAKRRSSLQCANCGVEHTSPWPTQEELERAYGTWYRPTSGRFRFGGDALLARTRGHLARRIDRIAPPGPVLDVGAGDGHLVKSLRARGRAAVGIERVDPGIEGVAAGTVEETTGPWAAVVFWHSLEHLETPWRALASAARSLADGGVIIVAIPNASSWQARLFGDAWLGMDIPRHLVHVPRKVLLRTLVSLDLRVERCGTLRAGQSGFGWLHGLVGVLPGRPHLYDAIRTPTAREHRQSAARTALAVSAAAALSPLAVIATALEAAAGHGGMTYVEARRVLHAGPH